MLVVLLLSALVLSALTLPLFQEQVEGYFQAQDRFAALQTLFVTLGSALLGAAAITSSLVLFAMQVNVQRMPHGLFNKLSSDSKLLFAFGSTFILAVAVVTLSLIPNAEWAARALLFSLWATAIILILFLFGYRRALLLINPSRQIESIVSSAHESLSSRARRAIRFAPIFERQIMASGRGGKVDTQSHDLPRLAYFQSNPSWCSEAVRAVSYAISISRRYSEQGDHEVSSAALNATVAINASYIEAKGKTFFTYNLMADNPLVSDSVINSTLEHLRQNFQIGLARGDEQQLKQTLWALAALVQLYLSIDYANRRASKTHAHLAVGYLTNEIERTVRHNMPDVLMEGVRILGKCSDLLFLAEGPKGIKELTQKIGLISCAGATKEEYRPVTSTGVEQLARLILSLLHARSHNIKFAARDIREAMKLIATLFLTIPEAPLSSVHSTYLGPYYSSTSNGALSAQIELLINAIANADAQNSDAIRLIHNFAEWADGMYATEKVLLLEAIGRRSSFTFDIMYWIVHVTKALLALSNAAACDNDTRDHLRKHAVWLISTLSFIPGDLETIQFAENFRTTEILFESGIDAHDRDCTEVSEAIFDILLTWMFKAGQFHTGWSTLETSICGLAVLAMLMGDQKESALKAAVAKSLSKGGLPDEDVRRVAALEIRDRAESLPGTHYSHSTIERYMAEANPQRLRPLLEELANLISPKTSFV